MKLRSLYILSIVGLLLVIVVQIGGMMYAYDNTKKEAERALNECFRLAFIETVDNEINNLPFPDMTIPFYSYLSKDSIRSFEDEMFLNYQQAASPTPSTGARSTCLPSSTSPTAVRSRATDWPTYSSAR